MPFTFLTEKVCLTFSSPLVLLNCRTKRTNTDKPSDRSTFSWWFVSRSSPGNQRCYNLSDFGGCLLSLSYSEKGSFYKIRAHTETQCHVFSTVKHLKMLKYSYLYDSVQSDHLINNWAVNDLTLNWPVEEENHRRPLDTQEASGGCPSCCTHILVRVCFCSSSLCWTFSRWRKVHVASWTWPPAHFHTEDFCTHNVWWFTIENKKLSVKI